jgi:hypothetical protein
MSRLGFPIKFLDFAREANLIIDSWFNKVTNFINSFGDSPVFIAYASVAQSMANNAFTKIICNVEDVDSANCYSTSTGRFTPTEAGYYQISGGVQTASNGGTMALVYKNGSEYARGSFPNSATVGVAGSISTLVYMNGTSDYVELYGFQSSGGSLNTAVSLRSLCYFQGAMVRLA